MFHFTTIPVYNGALMLGYVTLYTSLPVFSIVYDQDVDLNIALKFPILYKILQKGRVLSTKTFLIWFFKSLYQGVVIMIGCVVLFEKEYTEVVSQTFTSLIFIEILNVYLEVIFF
jgi:phospholipid-translocating ATPase